MPDESTTQGDPGSDNNGDAGGGTGGDTYNELRTALDREREQRRSAEREAKRVRELERQLEEFRSKSMSEQEKAIEEARKAGRTEALSSMNRRLVAANVRAAAAGRLTDPEDAIRFLDLDDFKVGDDGEVDSKSIAAAIDGLLKSKPYLAGGGRPAGGDADQGARGSRGAPSTMNDLIRSAISRR